MNRNNVLKCFSKAKNIYKNAMILYFTNSHNSYLFLHSIYCNSPHHVVSVTTGEKYKRTRILQKLWPQYHQELELIPTNTYIQTYSFGQFVACRVLVHRPGIEPAHHAVEMWSFNHWTSREVTPTDFKKVNHQRQKEA